MRNDVAEFMGQELSDVLRHYDIGPVHQIRPLAAGNRASPKVLVTTEEGTFVLKRRPKGKDDAQNVDFTHAVQDHLVRKGYPVAGLVVTQDEATALYLSRHTYELFHFAEGQRCDGSAAEVIEAGRHLALFHTDLRDFASTWAPTRQTYHDAGSVRGHLRIIRSDRQPRRNAGGTPRMELRKTADMLLTHYNQSSTAVNAQGFDGWPVQIVHADWHPGNLLFADRSVVCVLDFDSLKIAPPITDLANGVLQFSIVGVRPNPADWPAYLDQAKMAQFLEGYFTVERPPDDMLAALPDLMIEIMIAEAVLPIAATGYFGHHSGLEFLQMIHRKCDWIDENRKSLLDVVFH